MQIASDILAGGWAGPGAGFAAAAAAFLLAELWLYRARRKAAKAAQNILLNAKREVADIAQLPLHTPYPVIQVARDGRVVFANPAALETFEDLTRLGGRHRVLDGLDDYFTRPPRGDNATREIRYGNAIFQQSIATGKIRDTDVLIVYCHDITAIKLYGLELERARAAAEDAQKTAEKANQARGDFLANMSHELRTPMNGIIGLSDILCETAMAPKETEMIQALRSSARSLLTLLNDILDFSKIEAGELTIETIPFDIRALLHQIEQLQSPIARRKGLYLTTDIAADIPARLVGDPSRLQQILNNLVGNALKFTHEGGISLSLRGEAAGTDGYILRIAVADTGIGIPLSKHERIFTKFQQADSSTARKYGGTGLGLAITRDLAELMGGRIELDSTEGKGTVFTVVIPAKIPDKTLAATTPARAGLPSHAPETAADFIPSFGPSCGPGPRQCGRILIVDDHPINLLYLRRALTAMGYTDFDEATDGRTALAAFRAQNHALILLDCQMPDMDGFAVSREIRAMQHAAETTQAPPIIIAVTADAMKGTAEKCLAAGMDGYLSKPVDRDKLHQIVARFLSPAVQAAALAQIPDGSTNARSAHAPLVPPHAEALSTPSDVPAASESVPSPAPEMAHVDIHMDWAHLAGFTGNDRRVADEVLGIFNTMLADDIAELQRVFVLGDPAAWDRTVHKIYGAAANIGALRLAGLCDAGQNLGATGITDPLRHLHAAILSETQTLQTLFENGPVPQEDKAASMH